MLLTIALGIVIVLATGMLAVCLKGTHKKQPVKWQVTVPAPRSQHDPVIS